MRLELRQIFENVGEVLKFSYDTDFSEEETADDLRKLSPFKISGDVRNDAGVVSIKYNVAFNFIAPCDRCSTIINEKRVYSFTHRLVKSLQGDEENDLLLVEDLDFNLDELVSSDVRLELPMKNLCSEDCKGLCGKCGKNLNEGDCTCEKREIDPRLAILQQLLD